MSLSTSWKRAHVPRFLKGLISPFIAWLRLSLGSEQLSSSSDVAYVKSSSVSSVVSGSGRDSSVDFLSRILMKLGHLDLSNRILDRDPAKNAHGGYCDVFVGHVPFVSVRDRRLIVTNGDRVKVAIKHLRIRLNKEKEFARRLAREMVIWSKLNHPNILPFLGYTLERDYPSLVSEWMESGTARDFVNNHPGADITHIVLGIAEGLNYMHDKRLVHSDLKADNVLISPSGEPLICDFGISRMLNASASGFTTTTAGGDPRGSIRWMAIELFMPGESADHTKETDVWAFGMTFYEMLVRNVPYADLKNDMQVLLSIMQGGLPAFPDTQIDASIRPSLYSFFCTICRACWSKSPKERPTMSQIVERLSSPLNNAEGQQHQSRPVGAKDPCPSSVGQQNTQHSRIVADQSLALTPTHQIEQRGPIDSTHPNNLQTGYDDMAERVLVVGGDSRLEIDDDQTNLDHPRFTDHAAEPKSAEGVTTTVGPDDRFEPLEELAASSTREGDPRGSVRWMAIESHIPGEGLEPKHTKEADVWAFGMTLYELLARELPNAHLEQYVHVLTAVMKGEPPILPGAPINTSLSRSVRSAICKTCRGCWDRIVGTLSSLLSNATGQAPVPVNDGPSETDDNHSNLEHHRRNDESSERAIVTGDAMNTSPEDHFKALEDHASSLVKRFKHGGDVTYLTAAIDTRRSTLALIPEQHADRSLLLNNLGYSLCLRYERTGNIEDITESIESHRSALALRPEGNLDRSMLLNNLGYSLTLRFERTGDIRDINESIEFHRSALALRPVGNPDRSRTLTDLGRSLSLRFKRTGNIRDITESIESHRSAVALSPEGNPYRSMSLSSLGGSLALRFERMGDIDDITESIELHRSALALRPEGHPRRSSSLENLGHSLTLRFERMGDIDDITESIESRRSALALRPEGHPRRSSSLGNLGYSLTLRFERMGDIDDITESIESHRSALALRPGGHPRRSMSLSSLGRSLSLRFERTGDIVDITESIQLFRLALDLRPEGHPLHFSTLNNLINSLSSRFDKLGNVEDREEVIQLRRTIVSQVERHS